MEDVDAAFNRDANLTLPEFFKLSPFSRFVSGITDESPDHVHKPVPKDVLYQLLLQSLKYGKVEVHH